MPSTQKINNVHDILYQTENFLFTTHSMSAMELHTIEALINGIELTTKLFSVLFLTIMNFF